MPPLRRVPDAEVFKECVVCLGVKRKRQTGQPGGGGRTCRDTECVGQHASNLNATRGRGRSGQPGTVTTGAAPRDEMPTDMQVESISDVLGWRVCVPHLLSEVERLSGPRLRRHQYLVCGSFSFNSSDDDPQEYVIVAKPETYWVNAEDLREHGGYDEIMKIVASSLEEAAEALERSQAPAPASATRRSRKSAASRSSGFA